ncbi:MAG: protein kinase [Planctomycetes bacterium]|nr:protein kinase [Planctomycetota bacterium]
MQPSGGQATGETTRPYADVIPPPSPAWSAPAPSGGWAAPSQARSAAPQPSASGSQRLGAGGQARLGPFVVERELARGGMGVVYVARHEHLGRRVALKVMKAGAWADPEEAERFRFEAQAAARLKHPHIVGLHEVGQANGTWYLAMDLVEGPGSLQAMLERQGPLEPRFAAGALEQVARAVHFAHTRSVLHRDLKPHNVLVDEQGEPHLTDFGLAKDIGREEKGFTVTGQVLGTPAYMAPEQASGDPALVDRRSDVYGLGATLYACLTGGPPFKGNGVMDLLRKVLEEEPAPPSSVRPGLDRDLETIVLTCLRKDPAARYTTAQLLADDLARLARGEPIAARRPGAGERVARWLRRHARAAVAGVAVVAVAGGAIAVSRVAADRDARRQIDAAAARERAAQEAAVGEARAGSDAALAAVGDERAPDEGLALALRALMAAQRWRDLARDEASAARVREAQQALGDAAVRAKQFGVAVAVFQEAGDAEGVDRAIAARDGQGAAAAREVLALVGARERFEVRDADVVPLLQQASPGVVALLADALDDERRRLDAGERLAPGSRNRVVLACLALGAIAGQDPARAEAALAPLVPLLRAEVPLRLRVLEALANVGTPGALETFVDAVLESEVPEGLRRLFSDVAFDRLPGDGPDALLRRARARLAVASSAEHLQAALGDLDAALALEPDRVEALRERGVSRARLRDHAGARRDLDRAAALAPRDLTVAMVQSEVAYGRGDLAEARRAADRAVALAPGDAAPLLVRAKVARFADPAAALEDATRACQLAPWDASAHVLRAELLLRRGDPRAALEVLTHARSRGATSAELWVIGAHACLDMDALDQAQEALDRADALQAGGVMFVTACARLRLRRNEPARARDLLDQALRQGEHHELLLLRAEAHVMLGADDAAEADMSRALEKTGPTPLLLRERAILRRSLGKLEGARADLEASLRLDPDDPSTLAERARLRLDDGDLDGAADDAERSLARREHPQALNVRGRVRLARGDLAGGAADLERALDLAPGAVNADELRELIRLARTGQR